MMKASSAAFSEGRADIVTAPAREVARNVIADDRDHLAHDGDADVGLVALAHDDLLLRVAIDRLVEAEEPEVGVVVLEARDLEHASCALGVVTEARRAVEA